MERLPSLADAQARFFDDLALEGRSSGTLKTYRSFLRPLATGANISTLTPEACRRLIGDKLASGAYSTARTYAGVLSSFSAFLALVYGVPNPMAGVPTPRPKRQPHRFLTRDEITRLWLACPDESYRIMFLLLLEGVRAAEAVGARWRDITGDVLLVKGKGHKYRSIALSAPLLALLERREGETILGYGYQNLLQRVKRLGRLAGIPGLHPHLLRHTFASQALLEGMDSETLKALGGWSANSQVVQRYIESAREQAALARSRDFGLVERLIDGGKHL